MQRSSENGNSRVVDSPRIIYDMDGVSTPRGKRVRDADGLTVRQRQVIEIIRIHMRVRNLPPSRSELAAELKLSHPSAVDGHLNALEKKGWLETYPSIERGIRLLREGAPLYEDPADLLDLDTPPARRRAIGTKEEPTRLHDFDSFATLFEYSPDFFLRLPGDGTDLAGYQAGDVLAVVRGREPLDGDVVVGKVGQDITLRRATSLKDKEFEVIGVVVGAIVGTRRGT